MDADRMVAQYFAGLRTKTIVDDISASVACPFSTDEEVDELEAKLEVAVNKFQAKATKEALQPEGGWFKLEPGEEGGYTCSACFTSLDGDYDLCNSCEDKEHA
jgi:hypothetical protein